MLRRRTWRTGACSEPELGCAAALVWPIGEKLDRQSTHTNIIHNSIIGRRIMLTPPATCVDMRHNHTLQADGQVRIASIMASHTRAKERAMGCGTAGLGTQSTNCRHVRHDPRSRCDNGSGGVLRLDEPPRENVLSATPRRSHGLASGQAGGHQCSPYALRDFRTAQLHSGQPKRAAAGGAALSNET